MKSKYWIFVFYGLIFFFLVGCSENKIDTSVADSLVKKINKNKELTTYMTNVGTKYSYSLVNEFDNGEKRFAFNIDATGNEDFKKLPDKDKYEVMLRIVKFLAKNGGDYDFKCGKKNSCYFNELRFKDGKGYYQMDTSIQTDVLFYNDELVYQLESTPSNNNIEKSISNSDQAVYSFMKKSYEELTNNGENYIPEIHDPLVAKMASEKFGITPEEAGQLYVEIEMSSAN